MDKKQNCPICSASIGYSPRYPKQVCEACAGRTSDADGRRISFITVSFAGGLLATYDETGGRCLDRFCYIDNIKCRAEEDRFGRGIVVQTAE